MYSDLIRLFLLLALCESLSRSAFEALVMFVALSSGDRGEMSKGYLVSAGSLGCFVGGSA